MVDSRRRLALIHNGIIENYLPLKKRLMADGWTFSSDTDTEVVANLISSYLDGSDLRSAVARAIAELEGMYAFAVVTSETHGQEIVAARQGPPLVIGLAKGEQFLASDPAALLAYTKDVVFLENGDLARLTPAGVEIQDGEGKLIQRPVQHLNWDPVQAEKGGYKHFMLKEIHEQPQAVQDTFAGRVDFENAGILFDTVKITQSEMERVERLHLLACGTSWHAALIGKFMIEDIARLPVEVDYGSEYRYRDPIVSDRVLAVGISQSGETADTLSAMEAARDRGARLFSVCNVVGSQATRISEGVIYTHAGPEIGVASTKAFTTQLVALYLLALYLRECRFGAVERHYLDALTHLPRAVGAVLRREERHMDELRRLSRRRDEARPHRLDRRAHAGGGHRHGRPDRREGEEQHAGGQGAGRHRHRPDRPRSGGARRHHRRDHPRALGLAAPAADRQRGSSPAPRLLHRRAKRRRRRPAAESGEERDGGVGGKLKGSQGFQGWQGVFPVSLVSFWSFSVKASHGRRLPR
jgi:glucosamine--fructose-6-phosphate aminotransferase (isomerizing)